jgi:hypothetical protein
MAYAGFRRAQSPAWVRYARCKSVAEAPNPLYPSQPEPFAPIGLLLDAGGSSESPKPSNPLARSGLRGVGVDIGGDDVAHAQPIDRTRTAHGEGSRPHTRQGRVAGPPARPGAARRARLRDVSVRGFWERWTTDPLSAAEGGQRYPPSGGDQGVRGALRRGSDRARGTRSWPTGWPAARAPGRCRRSVRCSTTPPR